MTASRVLRVVNEPGIGKDVGEWFGVDAGLGTRIRGSGADPLAINVFRRVVNCNGNVHLSDVKLPQQARSE
jgi:hypothetical protein